MKLFESVANLNDRPGEHYLLSHVKHLAINIQWKAVDFTCPVSIQNYKSRMIDILFNRIKDDNFMELPIDNEENNRIIPIMNPKIFIIVWSVMVGRIMKNSQRILNICFGF